MWCDYRPAFKVGPFKFAKLRPLFNLKPPNIYILLTDRCDLAEFWNSCLAFWLTYRLNSKYLPTIYILVWDFKYFVVLNAIVQNYMYKFDLYHSFALTRESSPRLQICFVFCLYRGSPDSTNFGPPGDCTIVKIVLSGDWFSTKIGIWDF